jgi:deazaflavin-dependent oxidoreductase (nitroreductase family)
MDLGAGRQGLVLTTRGRKTGKRRSTPLVFMWHDGDIVVFPSNGGLERPPAWLLNLEAAPDDVHVQIGDDYFPVRARLASDEERARILPRARAYNAHWKEYLTYVRRELPFVLLTPR